MFPDSPFVSGFTLTCSINSGEMLLSTHCPKYILKLQLYSVELLNIALGNGFTNMGLNFQFKVYMFWSWADCFKKPLIKWAYVLQQTVFITALTLEQHSINYANTVIVGVCIFTSKSNMCPRAIFTEAENKQSRVVVNVSLYTLAAVCFYRHNFCLSGFQRV